MAKGEARRKGAIKKVLKQKLMRRLNMNVVSVFFRSRYES